MKISILMIIMIISLCACQDNTSKKTVAKNSIESDEDFETFIDKFYSDTNFQKTRLNDPLEGEIIEWNEDESVNKSGWKNRDINITDYETILKYKPNTKHSIEKMKETFVEKIYIENSGFSMERKFVLNNGKWYLKEYNISNL